MRYKDIHFYTTTEHIDYMKNVEKFNDIKIGEMLREYWNCNNMNVASILEEYYRLKGDINE